MKPKQYHFNVYSKVVCIIFQVVFRSFDLYPYANCACYNFYLALHFHCALQHHVE